MIPYLLKVEFLFDHFIAGWIISEYPDQFMILTSVFQRVLQRKIAG